MKVCMRIVDITPLGFGSDVKVRMSAYDDDRIGKAEGTGSLEASGLLDLRVSAAVAAGLELGRRYWLDITRNSHPGDPKNVAARASLEPVPQ